MEIQRTKALDYYLEHLCVDLRHQRPEFLRHSADRICAMLNGYHSNAGAITGNYEQYKHSCYASQRALAYLRAGYASTGKWSAEGLRQEHAIPLKVIGDILIAEFKDLAAPCPRQRRWDIAARLNQLVTPCLLLIEEDVTINQTKKAANSKSLKNAMPEGWQLGSDPWARYKAVVNERGERLFDKIVFLRPNLPQTPSEMPPASNIEELAFLLPPHIPITAYHP